MFELFTKEKTSSITRFPKWRCPSCLEGTVICNQNDIITRETTSSKNNHAHEAWDPDWIRMNFAAFLRCDNDQCGDILIATGPARVMEQDWQEPNGQFRREYFNTYTVSSVVPAPPLFLVKDCVPANISLRLDVVFALFWIDPFAAIGHLRICVEDILTDKKVKRFTNKNGKQTTIKLHHRIEQFEKKNSDAAKTLMALKWIGNSGSHAGTKNAICRDQVIEVLEIFEHALDQIYDLKNENLAKKIAVINKKKGI